MITAPSRRFGFTTPLSWIYSIAHILVLINAFVLVALVVFLGTLSTDVSERWASFRFYYVYSSGFHILVPIFVEFWLSHVFFRVYYWILNALLVAFGVWAAVQVILLGLNDIDGCSDLCKGPGLGGNSTSPDYAVVIVLVLLGVLVLLNIAYVLLALYIRRRTHNRVRLDAVASAFAGQPAGAFAEQMNGAPQYGTAFNSAVDPGAGASFLASAIGAEAGASAGMPAPHEGLAHAGALVAVAGSAAFPLLVPTEGSQFVADALNCTDPTCRFVRDASRETADAGMEMEPLAGAPPRARGKARDFDLG